jgi:hypothetical protein
MYDALSARYTFPCPRRERSAVRLSSFRELERLPGASHPAVFRVRFSCACGDEHLGLVRHDELDWAPLGLEEREFLNLMTDRLEPLAREFSDLAARRIAAGSWPWSFFCSPEERPRPVFPSMFRLLLPAAAADVLGLAVRCPACGQVSVNVVSSEHVDVPFYNDAEVGVLGQVFSEEGPRSLEELRRGLRLAPLDVRRLSLN